MTEKRIGAFLKVDPTWSCHDRWKFPENHQKASEAIYGPVEPYPDRRPIPNVWQSHQDL